jgi:multiple antibiotic resistance protein
VGLSAAPHRFHADGETMTQELVTQMLNTLALVPLTLLPIINPLSSAPIFSMTAGTDRATVRQLARQVATNCWIVIVAAIFVGGFVLDLFGISLPIVRIGGGLLVAASGWRLLNRSDDEDAVTDAVRRSHPGGLTPAEIARRSFFPITFPLTTGPGTIAASIAIGAGLPRQPTLYIASAAAALAGATLTVAAIYIVYRNAPRLLAKLGEVGTLVMARLMAFVLLCIGIQIVWTGWAELNGIAAR